MSTYSFDELMSSHLAHEARLSRCHEKVEEKAFQVKGKQSSMRNTTGRGHGRGGFHGRGCGRERGQYGDQRQPKGNI